MMSIDAQGLRGFMAKVETHAPELVLRFQDPASLELETTSAVFELEAMNRGPLCIFEHITGKTMPLVTNITGCRELLALALDCDVGSIAREFRDRAVAFTKPEIVEAAPWQEVVLEGDAIDLTQLPVPRQFCNDAGPYITAGQISARDPVSGLDTTGFHRLRPVFIACRSRGATAWASRCIRGAGCTSITGARPSAAKT